MDSHKKGQSALEYLMTYGWALVVIVVVIAALVLLVGNPQSADSCQTPGSGFSITNQNLVAAAVGSATWTVRVSNITGRTMTFQASSIPDWTPDLGTPANTDVQLNGAAIAAQTLGPGAAATVTILAPTGGASVANTKYSTAVTLNYTDADSFARTIPLNCTGTA